MVRIVEVSGDQIEVHADIGPGRVLSATLKIEDSDTRNTDPSKMPFDEWEKNFNAMCELAPVNESPADVSREAMYLSDEELGPLQQ